MKFLYILFVFLLFCNYSFGSILSFTKEEKNYLENKKILNLCTRKDFIPFGRFRNGTYEGISSDIYKIVEKKLNIDLKIVPLQKLDFKNIKNKNCDIVNFLDTMQNYQYLKVTKTVINSPYVLVTNIDVPFINNLSTLKNKKIAILNNKTLLSKITKRYPNLHAVEVDSPDKGLELLKKNLIFGYIDSFDMISYKLKQNEYKDMKVSSKLKESLNLGSGVVKNETTLFNIMDKTLQTIPKSEIETIRNSWHNFKDTKDIDYELIMELTIIAFTILLFLLHRQYELNKLNIKLKEQIKTELDISRKKDNLIFQQNKMASLGEMVGNIGHQWRQPLSEITMSQNIILSKLKNNDLDKELLINELKDSQKLLKYMSNTIDTFEKLYGNSNKTASKDIFAEDLIKEVEYILKEPIKLGTIKLIQKIDSDLLIKNDNNSLIQVLLSILQNSIYFFKERDIKDPKIFISIKKHRENICITIGDNAGGIQEDILPYIFDYSFSARGKNNKSTGIGLYISKLIIEEVFKGTIYSENRNNGISFIIDLPA